MLLAAFVIFAASGRQLSAQPAMPNPVQVAPSKQLLQQLILQFQAEALRCDQKIVEIAKQVFEIIAAYKRNQDRFPESVSDLSKSKNQSTNNSGSAAFPPRNPYMDPNLVSKDLRKELLNATMPPSEFCKIIIENDPFLSASFPASLPNIKLKPESAEPGTIVVHYNGDYYLAVWCIGFTGKPILDEKTQLPLVLFKDFSLSSCRCSERAGE